VLRPLDEVAVDVISADPVDDPDDLANRAEREPLASHVPDADPIGSLLLAKLNVSRYRPD
jgi:hypothetical protein